MWGVNCKLQLPKTWKCFHPIFHNSLISPYNETPAHGPNFTRPPPEIVWGEDDHYEVESVLQSRLTPNKKGAQYLIKWKGYPSSENSWLPASQMKSASTLVHQFHFKNPKAPRPISLRMLTAQQPHKEGINQGIGPRRTDTEPPCYKGNKRRTRPFGFHTGLGPDGPQEIHAVTL